MLRLNIRNGLLVLNLLVIVLVAVIVFVPSSTLRIVLGLPFVLFFPGYALMTALFPRQARVAGIERIALSFGLSIAVVSLTGLILNYTPWGIRLESTLYSTASFILTMSIIAWFRQRGLPEQERFDIRFQLRIPSWGTGTLDKTLSIVLVLTIISALGMLGYTAAAHIVGEKLTEFYFLKQQSTEFFTPSNVRVGKEEKMMVGVVNNEYAITNYRIEVRIDGVTNNEVDGITLKQGERWEYYVSFTPTVAGKNQKVEFLLYKNGAAEPIFEPLRLWIDVTN